MHGHSRIEGVEDAQTYALDGNDTHRSYSKTTIII